MNVTLLIVVFMIGILGGSFVNRCVMCIPAEVPILKFENIGVHNNKQLKWYKRLLNLICLNLTGCLPQSDTKKLVQCTWVVLAHGLIYVLLLMKFGVSLLFIKYCFFASLLFVIGLIDFSTQFVYSSTIIVGALGGVIFTAIECFQLRIWPSDATIGALIGFLLIGLIVWITGGMGEGDIEIAALCGLFTGITGVLLTIFLSFILGGMAGVILLGLRKKGRKDEMAFGPYLALGALMTIFFGHELLGLYLKLL